MIGPHPKMEKSPGCIVAGNALARQSAAQAKGTRDDLALFGQSGKDTGRRPAFRTWRWNVKICWILLAALGLVLAAGLASRGESPDSQEEQPNNTAITELIAQLGSGEFTEREQASQRLGDIGESAVPRLRAALKSPDLEVRFRARDVLHNIHHRLYSQRLALEGHGDVIVSIAVSPDGRRALSGGNDGTI